MKSRVLYWKKSSQDIKWEKSPLEIYDPKNGWFAGGKLNACANCLDRHLDSPLEDALALIWESESGEKKKFSYQELFRQVISVASVMSNMGVRKGDIVIIYMPMIPEAIMSMLACARLGAIHSVVFAGFSAEALKDRIDDTGAKFVITSDIAFRRGKKILVKQTVSRSLKDNKSVKKVLIFDRHGESARSSSREILYSQEVCKIDHQKLEYEVMDSNDPLFILYTSGTTGKPKGIVHSTGGYLVHNYAVFKEVFNPKPKQIYWCTADIGWITGHSYVVYAPLMHGLTVFIQEGTPDYPDNSTWLKLINKYKINIFYTSPTAIRMLRKLNEIGPALPSLKILGTVGEPISPSTWQWFYKEFGKKKCRVIDTWWQTETGGFIISPRAEGKAKQKPGSATKPLTGLSVEILTEAGKKAEVNEKGLLVIDEPWPAMAMGIYKDKKRFVRTYWSRFKGKYLTGDFAYRDNDGDIWILGRSDDIMKVAGHRLSSTEIESAVNSVPEVTESAAIGQQENLRGERIIVLVISKGTELSQESLEQKINESIIEKIGKFAKASKIIIIDKLPKTRSGKIMRRLLKALANGEQAGDLSTLEDEISMKVIEKLRNLPRE